MSQFVAKKRKMVDYILIMEKINANQKYSHITLHLSHTMRGDC